MAVCAVCARLSVCWGGVIWIFEQARNAGATALPSGSAFGRAAAQAPILIGAFFCCLSEGFEGLAQCLGGHLIGDKSGTYSVGQNKAQLAVDHLLVLSHQCD